MIRFSALSDSPLLLCMVTTTVVAAAMPMAAIAQAADAPARQEDKDAPVNISAERMTGRPDREIHFEENVEIVRGGTTIEADRATYRVAEDQVTATGNIRMQRFGDRYTGDEVQLQIEAGEGFVTHPTYHLQRNNAQGAADRIDFASEDQAMVTEGTYSTCEGPDPDWYLKSGLLQLDKSRDAGYAKNTVVYFKGVPILGTPAISFPLSDARKSGALPPTIGSTNKGGLEVTLPYYFNIAPNRDLTLYPKIISRRGLQIGAEGRYLGQTYTGETRVESLYDDQQTGTNRYAVSSTHIQTFDQRWTFNWNLNAASDDNYPSDFASTRTASAQRLLLREMGLTYGASFWHATVRASNYQVLQDVAAPIARPYDRLPQLLLHAGRQDIHGFDWTSDVEATHFRHPENLVGDPLYASPNILYPRDGNRIVINPKLSYPIIKPGYFITPKVSLHASHYALDNVAAGAPGSLSRILPTASVDSGLVFERDTALFGKPVTQTLEPRLFYVYTPYRDQSQFPVFDTGAADFSYPQLFTENRFAGHDRISDANQLTAALVSRVMEPSGTERARFTIGQRYHFSDQRVFLPGVLNSQSRSDLLLAASSRLSQEISTEANIQYSQSLGKLIRSNYGVRWQPAPMSVLNLQYRQDISSVIAPLKQLDVSAQWPLSKRWYGVGRVNYSIIDRKPAEALLGAEYKADCWVFRAVAQRTPTSAQSATTGIFLQLELTGLSRIGSNPLQALRRSIPGYQMINQPTGDSR